MPIKGAYLSRLCYGSFAMTSLVTLLARFVGRLDQNVNNKAKPVNYLRIEGVHSTPIPRMGDQT